MSAADASVFGPRSSILAGIGAAITVHFGVIAALALAPAPERATRAATEEVVEGAGCTTVVSPCRLCAGGGAAPEREGGQPRSRRCPEPMRRLQRRTLLLAPRVEVDLLRAELVENFGDPTGTVLPQEKVHRTAEQRPPEERVRQVKNLIATSKLGNILDGGEKADTQRSKLGRILGTHTGKVGGDALVSRKGSAYVREVRLDMQRNFVLPGTVPVWMRKSLKARVRITRMTATGGVLAYSVEKKSGNDAFDSTVRSLLSGYKAGIRNLPEPPAHILSEINSRGLLVILRGG